MSRQKKRPNRAGDDVRECNVRTPRGIGRPLCPRRELDVMRRALARSCGAALATLVDGASASLGRSGWSHRLVWHSGVKTQANDLRTGAIFEDKEGRLLEVMRYEHTHGQGRASGFVTLEARDLRNGAKRTERLRPSDTVERVILDDTVR